MIIAARSETARIEGAGEKGARVPPSGFDLVNFVEQ